MCMNNDIHDTVSIEKPNCTVQSNQTHKNILAHRCTHKWAHQINPPEQPAVSHSPL